MAGGHLGESFKLAFGVVTPYSNPLKASIRSQAEHLAQHNVSLHSAQGTEKLVGQQGTQTESELTKSTSKESEGAQQEEYHEIIEKTKEFEALHRECVRVLPYENKESGQVYVQLYVFCGNNGIPAELQETAQEYFREMGVELKWTDLYNETSDWPKISFGVSKRLEKFKVDDISEIIKSSLPTFQKHRNITAMYPSLKITNSKQTEEPCIMISVVGKGRIPFKESKIPEFVDKYPVDIVEGFWIETVGTFSPPEAQVEHEYLRLGASIGNKEKKNAGTLGAFLKDNDNNFYLLSCYHVIERNEVVHPGRLHHLNSLAKLLTDYKYLLEEITGTSLISGFCSNHMQLTESELLAQFRELQVISDDCAYNKLSHSKKFAGNYKDFVTCAQKLEEIFKHPPRVVADPTRHSFTGNVRVYNVPNVYRDEVTFFMDAAVAKLKKEEVEAIQRNHYVEIIGTAQRPNGNVIPLTDICQKNLPHEPLWFKSGSDTGCSLRNDPQRIFVKPKEKTKEYVPQRLLHFDFQNDITYERHDISPCPEYFIFENTERTFANYGDSGAVIFGQCEGQRCMSGIGIVCGYVNDQTRCGIIFSPLDIVLKTLSCSMGKKLELVV